MYSVDRSVVKKKSAASLLLLWKYWSDARDNEYIDEFNWIGAEGLFDAGDLNTLGHLVW